jgi:hypothetical protein
MRKPVALVVLVLCVVAAVEASGGADAQTRPSTYALAPPGLRSTRGPHMGALAQGTLVGELVHGKVRTWLEDDGASRIVVAWPQTFRAHLHPLELLDPGGRVVARGGEHVRVGGGFRPRGDAPRERVFLASSVSRAIP